mgnify:CR=1 FL=1
MERFDKKLDKSALMELILDAADARFRLYGFKKTAMAEIAEDVGMSTANLYRYFPSKIDIAESFALRCFEEKEKALALIVNKLDASPEEKLQGFAFELLHYNYQQLQKYPTINDIIATLCAKKLALVQRKRDGEAALLADILRDGVNQASWQCADIEQASKTILATWVLFSTPTFMQTFDEIELEGLLANVIDLLLNGLKERN